MEKQNQKSEVSTGTSKFVNGKIKNHIFKPFHVSKSAQDEVKSNKIEFLEAIRDLQSKLELSDSGSNEGP